MFRTANYCEKLAYVFDFLPQIIETTKKDLKNEHLKQNKAFLKKYFPGKNPRSLGLEDLIEGYKSWIEEKDEEFAEWLAARWIMRKTELYDLFEERLKQVNPQFDQIEELEEDFSKNLIDQSAQEFSALDTFIFSVFNSVVFPDHFFQDLKQQAEEEQKALLEQEKLELEEQDIHELKSKYEREIKRLTDRYEKKLSGMHKKYIRDTEQLKTQIKKYRQECQV